LRNIVRKTCVITLNKYHPEKILLILLKMLAEIGHI
jgi:hypothetical protein